MSAPDVNELLRKSNEKDTRKVFKGKAAKSAESIAVQRKVQHHRGGFDLKSVAENSDSEPTFDLEPKPKSMCLVSSTKKEHDTDELTPNLEASEELENTWSVIYLSKKKENTVKLDGAGVE